VYRIWISLICEFVLNYLQSFIKICYVENVFAALGGGVWRVPYFIVAFRTSE
jgi:hypothetical protein